MQEKSHQKIKKLIIRYSRNLNENKAKIKESLKNNENQLNSYTYSWTNYLIL